MEENAIEKRKKSHLDLSLRPESQSFTDSCFDSLQLIHEAIPDLDFSDISIAQKGLGYSLKAPFFVSSMTGGWKESSQWNLKLAKACQSRGWAMGVGSQRSQLEDSKKAEEWRALRQACPDLILFGNIGLAQVLKFSTKEINLLVDSLKAQAMIVHCNPLQEAIQSEGTPQFKSGIQALKKLAKELPVPLIVKETGCGFSKQTLDRLTDLGLGAVDVSGLGGTHWGKIEGQRFDAKDFRFGIADTFGDWGISTLESLLYSLQEQRDYELWASGGMRTGVDAAKALSLGASLVGFAQPILKALQLGEEALNQFMSRLELELKVSLFCTGSASIKDLQKVKKWKWKI